MRTFRLSCNRYTEGVRGGKRLEETGKKPSFDVSAAARPWGNHAEERANPTNGDVSDDNSEYEDAARMPKCVRVCASVWKSKK